MIEDYRFCYWDDWLGEDDIDWDNITKKPKRKISDDDDFSDTKIIED